MKIVRARFVGRDGVEEPRPGFPEAETDLGESVSQLLAEGWETVSQIPEGDGVVVRLAKTFPDPAVISYEPLFGDWRG